MAGDDADNDLVEETDAQATDSTATPIVHYKCVYRSYYFDAENNLYYLQSRYYDPYTGRFLNIDSTEYLNNLFPHD